MKAYFKFSSRVFEGKYLILILSYIDFSLMSLTYYNILIPSLFSGPIWEKISTESKRIILGLLAVDPLRRFGTDELLAALGISIPENNSFKLAVSIVTRSIVI